MEGKEEEWFYFILLFKGIKYYVVEIVVIIGFKYKL